MDSFNVYRQTTETIGGNTPVWLGTVKPIPVGGYFDGIGTAEFFPAGTPVEFNPETRIITPLAGDYGTANGYLYNDVYVEPKEVVDVAEISTTGAVVMHHPEGLLIERAYPEITEEQIAQLQAKIPGVLLVRG